MSFQQRTSVRYHLPLHIISILSSLDTLYGSLVLDFRLIILVEYPIDIQTISTLVDTLLITHTMNIAMCTQISVQIIT